MLSYDWLKILAVVTVAIFALTVLFTMVSTRPRAGQEYTVHFYGGLTMGEDHYRFGNDLDDIFSYDVLETGTESFNSSAESRQAFVLRRSVNEGTAVFAANYTAEEEGSTPFQELCAGGLLNRGLATEQMGMFLDLEEFFSSAERYLARFFGEEWQTGEPDGDAVRTYFLERNGKDKRFRTAAQKETGVQLEAERLTTIRDDYLFVCDAFESGKLATVTYQSYTIPTENEEAEPLASYTVGIGLGKLTNIGKVCSYAEASGAASTQELVLLFYDNGTDSEHLQYENFTFLRYLLEKYA